MVVRSSGSDGKESAWNVGDLGWEDPLEKEMATHSSILAWRIPWAEETGRPQSMGSQRVRDDWMTNTFRKQKILVFYRRPFFHFLIVLIKSSADSLFSSCSLSSSKTKAPASVLKGCCWKHQTTKRINDRTEYVPGNSYIGLHLIVAPSYLKSFSWGLQCPLI